MNKKVSATKVCQSCGRSFECKHAPDCWCADFVIADEKREHLKSSFTDCLCPVCLAKYSSVPVS